MWKNIGLIKYKYSNIDNFTSTAGIKLRRFIHRPLRFVLKHTVGGKVIVQQYPKLEKKVPYIFAATHSFVDEVQVILGTLDRSAYTLIGTTDQLEHNPKIYANWLTGIIYVNRFDTANRKDSIAKMERIINSGSSVMLFPEGGWNNTENLLCQKLFASPYILAQKTGAKVVPVSCFYDDKRRAIYIRVSDPLDFSTLSKEAGLSQLRDEMASLVWEMIEEHSTCICRSKLGKDPRLEYMKDRCREYKKVKWSRDVWDEELTRYFDKNALTPEQLRETLDDVTVTKDNAQIMSEFLRGREEDKKYDFKAFMHNNWDKKV